MIASDAENCRRFEVQRKEHWIHKETYVLNRWQGKVAALFLVVFFKIFFFYTELAQCFNMLLALDVIAL